MNQAKINMSLLPYMYTIHRFKANYPIPLDQLKGEEIFHISKTDEELSVVCRESVRLSSDQVSKSYRCLKVIGPLDFNLVGIISKIARILKSRDIPIFAISTFDTDYILINKDNVNASIEALSEDEYISLTHVSN